MKKLSVIIVTYNSEKDIFPCLDALFEHCDLPREELEVLVVDNASQNAEKMFDDIRLRYGNSVTLIRNSHNGGYGQGNNLGISRAQAPVIMIMNPDVRLYQPVLKTATDTFLQDDRLTMYGMKQMFSDTRKSPYSVVCTYMMNGYLHTLLTYLANRFDVFWPRYMYFSGSCFFVSKQKFQAIGMFDESVFLYGEEDDIHYRMCQKFGFHMKYNPKLHYIHPMHLREPNLDYDNTIIDIAILQNEKKGYSRARTIKNRLRNIRCLLWRAKLVHLFRHNMEDSISFLQQREAYLKNLTLT